MYADIFGTLPIAEALVLKGVGLGTSLSFMMGVTALSLPSIITLSKVVKKTFRYIHWYSYFENTYQMEVFSLLNDKY